MASWATRISSAARSTSDARRAAPRGRTPATRRLAAAASPFSRCDPRVDASISRLALLDEAAPFGELGLAARQRGRLARRPRDVETRDLRARVERSCSRSLASTRRDALSPGSCSRWATSSMSTMRIWLARSATSRLSVSITSTRLVAFCVQAFPLGPDALVVASRCGERGGGQLDIL